AQHFLAIGIVAATFAPEIRRLQRRHEQLQGACPVLLLLDDALHLHQHLVAERQPGIASGRLLLEHASAQHELVRDDLRLLGCLLEEGEEVLAQPHGNSRRSMSSRVPITRSKDDCTPCRYTMGAMQNPRDRGGVSWYGP